MKKIKFLMMVAGILAIGLGIGLLRVALLGTDPFSVFVNGLTLLTGISFGTTQLVLNLFLFILQMVIAKKTIGPGSFVNMILVGYLSDFFLYMLKGIRYVGVMPFSILLLGAAILIISMGVSLYAKSDLGLAPYDSLGIILAEKTTIKYKWCRMFTDFLCVAVGFLLHSTAGIATLFMALGTGPFVEFFNTHLSQPLLAGSQKRRRKQRLLLLKGTR